MLRKPALVSFALLALAVPSAVAAARVFFSARVPSQRALEVLKGYFIFTLLVSPPYLANAAASVWLRHWGASGSRVAPILLWVSTILAYVISVGCLATAIAGVSRPSYGRIGSSVIEGIFGMSAGIVTCACLVPIWVVFLIAVRKRGG